MANKKKVKPKGYEVNNKLITGLLEKTGTYKNTYQFRRGLVESQSRVNYQNEFDRLQGSKRLSASHPNVKQWMEHIQNKARASLQGVTKR